MSRFTKQEYIKEIYSKEIDEELAAMAERSSNASRHAFFSAAPTMDEQLPPSPSSMQMVLGMYLLKVNMYR
jgi:uncharacterized protein HemY